MTVQVSNPVASEWTAPAPLAEGSVRHLFVVNRVAPAVETAAFLPTADVEVAAAPIKSVRRVLSGTYWLSGQPLRRPMNIKVVGDADAQLLVSESRTGIFGSGGDLAEAIADFRSALVDHRDFLESSGQLSKDLEAQLALLRDYLEPAE